MTPTDQSNNNNSKRTRRMASQLAQYGVTFTGNGRFHDANGTFVATYQGPIRGLVYKEYIGGKWKGRKEVFMSHLEFDDLEVNRNVKRQQLMEQRNALHLYNATRPERES